MQVIKSKTVVKLSKQELEDAVRLYVDKEKGFWIDEFDIELDGYKILKSEQVVNKDGKEDSEELSGWKLVPPQWDKKQPPEDLEPGTKVNIVFKNSSKDYNRVATDLDFSQKASDNDIVWYRIVK